MPTRGLVGTFVAALLGTSGALAAEAPGPWTGTWMLNPARSSVRSGPAEYKRTTLRIRPSSSGLTVTYDMVGVRGGRTHVEWTGALDGQDYALQGVDYVLTNAYRLIDERSYEIAVKVDGRMVATTRVTIAPDGRTLTAVTTEQDTEGHDLTTTAVYERQ